MDVNLIPPLYTWIRQNWASFISITVMLLGIYAVYNFIGGYAKPFGEQMATHHEELKRAVASYTALDSILNKELLKFKASRVGLFRFHDGERGSASSAYFFVSVANILAAPGVSIDLPSITNVPASTYQPILSTLAQQKSFFSTLHDFPSGLLKELELNRGTQSILYVPIDDLQDNLIGFIMVAWLRAEDTPVDADRAAMLNSLENDSTRISGFFSLSGAKDKK